MATYIQKMRKNLPKEDDDAYYFIIHQEINGVPINRAAMETGILEQE